MLQTGQVRRHLLSGVERGLVIGHDGVCLVDPTAADVSVITQQRIFVPVSVILNRLTLVLQIDRVVAAVGGRPVHQTLVLDLQLLICVRVASSHRFSRIWQQGFVQNSPVV